MIFYSRITRFTRPQKVGALVFFKSAFLIIGDGESEESEKSGSTKLMGVAGLVIFFALVALTVLYRRRKIMRSAQLANPSPRASTDSWLYPEPHEFSDEVNLLKSSNRKNLTTKIDLVSGLTL